MNKKIKFKTFPTSLFLIIALILVAVPAYADNDERGKHDRHDHQPTITQVSFINDNEIQIVGSDLGDDDWPKVKLGHYELFVSFAEDTLIQASLPPGVVAGEYLLTVSKDDDGKSKRVASYDLTVGAALAVNLDNHTSNTANPHGVTTSQIGAATPGEITLAVGSHASIPSAHHSKTSSFTELADIAFDAQIPASIARDSELNWLNLAGIPAGFADGVDDGLVIGTNTTNYIPKWNGSTLVSGSIFDNGHVGIGTGTPGNASLYVRGNVAGPIADIFGVTTTLPSHHVAVIENSRATATSTDMYNSQYNTAGLAIVLNNHDSGFLEPYNRLNSNDHFVSFYSKDNGGVSNMVGRIEGASLLDLEKIATSVASSVADLAMINPLSMFEFDFTDMVVPTTNSNWLSWTPPSALFNAGAFPTPYANDKCEGNEGSLANQVCIDLWVGQIDMGLDGGSLPTLNFNPGALNVTASPIEFTFNEPTFGFNRDIASDLAARVTAFARAKNQSEQKIWSIIHDPVGFKLELSGLGSVGGVTYASGAGDYAEWLERSNPEEKIHMAEIVGVKGGKISKSTEDTDHVLVTSFKPIVLGNMPPSDKEHLFEKVAFMGQTLVKVRGPAHKGYFILPSGLNDGVGIAVSPDEEMTPDRLSQIVGVVWSDEAVISVADIKMVNIAVGLRSSEVAKVVKVQQLAMDALRVDLNADKRKVVALTAQNNRLAKEIKAMRSQVADLATLNAKFTTQQAKIDRLSSRVEMLVRAMASGNVAQAHSPSTWKE